MKFKEESTRLKQSQNKNHEPELFSEKFNNFKVRDYSNNTRMNIKNHNYSQQKEKRERAMNYWQNQVIQNYLPPIDQKKRQEMIELKRQASTVNNRAKKP